jgi:pimeloyl-ACP methyl ester carboxylesterase
MTSTLDGSGHTHNTAPTRFVEADGIRFAYRRFGGPAGGTPIVLLQHFMGNLDGYDPAITDALAKDREVILTDNAGVGLSTGTAPETVSGMARGAATPRVADSFSGSGRGPRTETSRCRRPPSPPI